MTFQRVLVAVGLCLGCRGDVATKGNETSTVESPSLAEGEVPSDSAAQAICRGLVNSYKCAQAVETSLLQPAEGSVLRSERRLRIALESGDSLILVDSVGDHPDGVWHSYRGLLVSVGYHVVELQFYEGGGFLLVNRRAGWSTRSNGIPEVSPDGARLAAGSVDLDAEYTPTTLQIWVVAADTLALEFEHDFVRTSARPDSVWGPRRVEWQSPTVLLLTREFSSGEVSGTARALRGRPGWTIAP